MAERDKTKMKAKTDAALQARKRASALQKVKGRATSRRRPGEAATLAASVKSFCSDCMGFESDGQGSLHAAIEACSAPECWLWPWRNGKFHPENIEDELSAGKFESA